MRSACLVPGCRGKMWIMKFLVAVGMELVSWVSFAWVSASAGSACSSAGVELSGSAAAAASTASWYVKGLFAMSDCAASLLSANDKNDDG